MVAGFGFGGRDIPDGLQQPPMVEPVHPFQGRELHGVEAFPWSAAVNDLGFVEPVAGLGERVVITVADTADRGLDACFRQPLGVANGDVLFGFNRSL